MTTDTATTEISAIDNDDEWVVLSWLWQSYRHDLAPVVSGLPYADGRYQTRGLPVGATDDVAAYLTWRPHPNTGERAPIAFAVVDGLTGARRSIAGMWVAPAVRQDGTGMKLATTVIARHPGPWAIAFQHDNHAAGAFWRRVADAAFGAGAWREEARAVPGHPDVPPDHWIETLDTESYVPFSDRGGRAACLAQLPPVTWT
ncbi:GNAT family N-acetyltransferase [Luteipulveratus mongoliensis]|uniref:GNAT family N-acetyltransferase n=1 Tax=Luteipulveratus mongoliensis TaxID=571913 RepID=UPI0006968EC4|nr:hypothetical protein [Luteipulveratus mongoliensis]